MNKKEIEKKIVELLEEVGISIDNELDLEKEDIDLRECFVDSFSFISFVVELENTFDIAIPEEYTTMDHFSSLRALVIVIQDLL